MSESGNTKVTVGCIRCGEEREITRQQIRRTKYTGLCADCSRDSRRGENHPSWRGGLRLSGENGEYLMIHKIIELCNKHGVDFFAIHDLITDMRIADLKALKANPTSEVEG